MTASGLSIHTATVSTQTAAKTAITTMDTALETIATEQATLGSLINRFNYSVNNLSRSSVATEQALGRIMDSDFASESTNLSPATNPKPSGNGNVGSSQPVKELDVTVDKLN